MIPLHFFEAAKELREYQDKIVQLYAQRNKSMTEADVDFSNSLFEDTVCLSHNNLLEAINQFKEQGLLSGIEEETEHFETLLLKKREEIESEVKRIDEEIKDLQKIKEVTRAELEREILEILPEIKVTPTFYKNKFKIGFLGSQKNDILKYLEDNNIIFEVKEVYFDTYIIIEDIIIRDFNINGVKVDLDIIEVIEKTFKIELVKKMKYKSAVNPRDLIELHDLLKRRKIYFDLVDKGEKPPFIVPYIKEN
jgi:hypothetical protein